MSVLQWFEQNASVCPDVFAITCESRQLTYRELNSNADQIADGLRAAGMADGCLVGLLVDRSPEMVAALLGIWKAGAAYLPLDPAAPIERIAFMLEDAAPALVLTRRKFFSSVPRSPLLDVRLLDLDHFGARGKPSCPASRAVSADSLAYVIYTSGSTGKPKGVEVTHGGLANTVQAVGQDLKLTPDDIVLAWSTIAFDVAGLEIYLPLAFGARLYLVEKEMVKNGGVSMEQVRSFSGNGHVGNAHHVSALARGRVARRSEDAARRGGRGPSLEPWNPIGRDVPRGMEPVWAE